MGCFDVWCPLCGAPLNGIYYVQGYEDLKDQVPPNIKRVTGWMEKVTVLLPNKTIMNTREINCSATFAKREDEYYFDMDKNFEEGVALHDDCWRIAKKQKEKLSYKNFENKSMKNDYIGFTVKGLNYKPIEKYWSQTFLTDVLLADKKDWLLISPLKNKKNEERVIGNIKKLMKAKKQSKKSLVSKDSKGSKRPSPTGSATKFRIGSKRRGGDGNLWIVKKTKSGVRRWQRLK